MINKVIMMFSFMAFLLAGNAIAATYTTTTTSHHKHKVTIPDQTFVDTDTQRQAWGAGVGADLVVYRGTGYLDQIKIENRYDIENREYRGFVVGQIDLTKLWS